MNCRRAALGGILATIGLAIFTGLSGCLPSIFLNQTKERTGNVTMVFVNNTEFTAAFSYGTYDAWDRTPGPVALEQLRLAPGQSSSPTTVPCRRTAAVGTQDFVTRVLATEADQTSAFDPEAFSAVVNFSAAPSGSSTSGLPTAGTAVGQSRLLGVDYSCADQLVFKFFQDPDAPGGFRIEFEDILDKPANG